MFCPDAIGRLLLWLIGDDGACSYRVALDRTNWAFGKTEINFLVIGVIKGGVLFPLVWTLLPSKGNSSCVERLTLLNRFLKLIPPARIEVLLGDREFIGAAWLKRLQQLNVPFIFRVRENLIVTPDDGSTFAVKRWCMGGYKRRLRGVKIAGIVCDVTAKRIRSGEVLCLISSGDFEQCPLKIYRSRWAIETLFGAIKSRGFRLEDTHLTALDRLDKLFAIVALAFILAVRTGEIKAAAKPIRIKNNGSPLFSLFQYGKNSLIHALTCAADSLAKLLKTICSLRILTYAINNTVV